MTQVILTALVGLIVAHAAFARGRAAQNWSIIRTYRFTHFIANLPVIALVVAVAVALTTLVPYMNLNPITWILSKIFHSGNGQGQGNLIFSGIQWKWYALIFLPVLMFALPTLAMNEEKSYREGTRNWRDAVLRSIRFGLAHLWMLIPMGAALALSIGGMWFTRQYFKGGVERSTTYHATYNTMIVAVLFVLILIA